MINLIWRSDVHLADQAPQSRKDDWRETMFEKLQQVGVIAGQERAAAVIDGGDLFHVKTPSRNAHLTNNRLMEIHGAYPCPTYGNVGNHDVKYGDLDYLKESPLGGLFESGTFRRLYDEHEVFFGRAGPNHPRAHGRAFPYNSKSGGWLDGNPFPLKEKGDVIVRVVGIPYHGTKYDLNRLSAITKGKEDYLVIVAHMLASPFGGTMFEKEDILRYSDLANHDADVWCFGHWHKNQGIKRITTGGKVVVNIGSLSRGSLSEDEVSRIPSVAVLRFDKDGIDIEEVPLKVQPPEKVFDIEGRTRQESRQLSVGQFVDNLREALVESDQKALVDEVREISALSDAVRERAILYLEETEE